MARKTMLPPGALHNLANAKEFSASAYTLELEQLFDNVGAVKRWRPIAQAAPPQVVVETPMLFSDSVDIYLSDSTTALIGYENG